jgi:cation diffusion facilitator family transporter
MMEHHHMASNNCSEDSLRDHSHHDHVNRAPNWLTTENRSSSLDHKHHNDNTILRKLIQASIPCAMFLLVEVIGGYLASSLAVFSHCAHMFAVLASFSVGIPASYPGSLPATKQHTLGLKRMESVAALFSMMCRAAVSVGLTIEAVRRLVRNDGIINGKLMSEIAIIGVLANLALTWFLGEHLVNLPSCTIQCHDHSHGYSHASHNASAKHEASHRAGSHIHNYSCNDHSHEYDLEKPKAESRPLVAAHKQADVRKFVCSSNIYLQAAYLHVFGDLTQSVTVFIAGLIIWVKPGWWAVDPICTLAFCALVFYYTLGVLRTSITDLLQEPQYHLDWNHVFDRIAAVKGIGNVHELHIWSNSQHKFPTFSVYCTANEPNKALEDIYAVISKELGIINATVKMQTTEGDCIACTDRLSFVLDQRTNLYWQSMG